MPGFFISYCFNYLISVVLQIVPGIVILVGLKPIVEQSHFLANFPFPFRAFLKEGSPRRGCLRIAVGNRNLSTFELLALAKHFYFFVAASVSYYDWSNLHLLFRTQSMNTTDICRQLPLADFRGRS